MNRHHGKHPFAAWMLIPELLLSAQALAQPRVAPEVEQVKQMPTPPTEEWLQRLPGRYVLDGVIHHVEIADFDRFVDFPDGEVRGVTHIFNEWTQPITGKADCIEFADGAPGLQCVINVLWPENWNALTGRSSLGGVSDLTPGMVLAGVNPDTQAIRFLLVDRRGLGHPGSQVLNGETATAKVSCVNLPGLVRCDQKFQITTKAESGKVFVVLAATVRYLRNKLDRKPFLNHIGGPESPLEIPHEWLDELLDVSFSLRREEPPPEPVDLAPDPEPVPASRIE